jgi:hypothetical protein
MTIFVFPDTNIWLHCRPLEQVDWSLALSDDDIRFVATDPVVRELDTLKHAGRTRDRARRALRQIELWASSDRPTMLRAGVSGRYWFPETVPNAAALGLDPTHPDDLLVAYAHDFKSARPGARVVLLTDDSGPRLTARRVGLEPLVPPEAAREPIQVETPEQAEVRRLRAEIEALRNRLPRIALRLKEGTAGGTRIELPPAAADSLASKDDYVRRALEEAQAHAPIIAPPSSQAKEKSPPKQTTSRALDLAEIATQLSELNSGTMRIHGSEYERYASDREQYLRKIEQVASTNWSILEENRRSAVIDILLGNDGSAPAEDVDIAIHVPDGPVVKEEQPETADLPSPPIRPRTVAEVLSDSLSYSLRPLAFDPRSLRGLSHLGARSNVSRPIIRRSNSYDIRIHVGRVKQHQCLRIAHLVLLFPGEAGPRSLTMEYVLNSATLAQPVSGQLHIVVRA